MSPGRGLDSLVRPRKHGSSVSDSVAYYDLRTPCVDCGESFVQYRRIEDESSGSHSVRGHVWAAMERCSECSARKFATRGYVVRVRG